ncbi:MAG: mannose-1-phosphate guanylyltransferase [Candidatus Spyradenecus sp.]
MAPDPALYAYILAGGQGERLWPLSVSARPKQFLDLFGGEPLLVQTFRRLSGVVSPQRCAVITLAELCEPTRELLCELPPSQILCEPCARNTAAAVAFACGHLLRQDPDAVLALLPADHVMTHPEVFRVALADAAQRVSKCPVIATLGVAPTFPATGYGYMACGDAVPTTEACQTAFFQVRRFVEKPDEATARAYLTTGRYLWNVGIFIARVSTFREAFRRHAPAYLPLIDRPEDAETLYPTLPKRSFDVAVMEHYREIIVARAELGWDDVGSLEAFARHFPADVQGNILLAPAVTLDASGNLVVSQGDLRTTALLGVHDLAVIHTPQATLICPRAQAQRLRDLLPCLPEALR